MTGGILWGSSGGGGLREAFRREPCGQNVRIYGSIVPVSFSRQLGQFFSWSVSGEQGLKASRVALRELIVYDGTDWPWPIIKGNKRTLPGCEAMKIPPPGS